MEGICHLYLILCSFFGVGGFFVRLFLEQDVFKLQIVVNRKSVKNKLKKSKDLVLRSFRQYYNSESVNESL